MGISLSLADIWGHPAPDKIIAKKTDFETAFKGFIAHVSDAEAAKGPDVSDGIERLAAYLKIKVVDHHDKKFLNPFLSQIVTKEFYILQQLEMFKDAAARTIQLEHKLKMTQSELRCTNLLRIVKDVTDAIKNHVTFNCLSAIGIVVVAGFLGLQASKNSSPTDA